MNRKTQGEVTVAPASVTAGSKQDFTITYKATEAMEDGDVIEIKLPADWVAPTAYQLDEGLESLRTSKITVTCVFKWIRH